MCYPSLQLARQRPPCRCNPPRHSVQWSNASHWAQANGHGTQNWNGLEYPVSLKVACGQDSMHDPSSVIQLISGEHSVQSLAKGPTHWWHDVWHSMHSSSAKYSPDEIEINNRSNEMIWIGLGWRYQCCTRCWKDWCTAEWRHPTAREGRTWYRPIPARYPARSTFRSLEDKVGIDRGTNRSRIQTDTVPRTFDWIPSKNRRKKRSGRRCRCNWNKIHCMVSTRNHPSGSERVSTKTRIVLALTSAAIRIWCIPAKSCTRCTELGTACTPVCFDLYRKFIHSVDKQRKPSDRKPVKWKY